MPPVLDRDRITVWLSWLLLGIWLLTLFPVVATAAPLELDGSVERHAADQMGLSMFRDPSGEMGPEAVRVAFDAGRFEPLSGNLGLGFTRDAVWLALEIARRHGAPADWVLELQPAFLDHVMLFEERSDGGFIRQVAGDALPLGERAVAYRAAAFELELAPGTTRLFVRVQTRSNVSLIPFLWQHDAFERERLGEAHRLGVYFGMMVLVLAYTLIAWLVSRNPIYLVYALFVASLTGQQLAYNGLLGVYLLPDDPLNANRLLAVMLSLTIAFGMRFYVLAMGVTRADRIAWGYLNGCVLLGLIAAASVPLGWFPALSPWLQGSVVLSTLFFVPTLLRLWRRRAAEGRLLVLAFVLFFTLIDITILATLGLLEVSMFTIHAAMVGHVVHLFLLHIGLYLRARDADLERVAAEAQAERQRLAIAHEREVRREQDHLLAMIRHEVQTPMAVISAAVQSLDLIDGERADEDPRNLRFERIHRAIGRMSMLMQLVGESLRGGEDPHGGLPLEPLDLAPRCREAIELLGADPSRFELDPGATSGAWILGHEQQLSFLLINLFDNAIKYGVAESPVTVSLTDEERDGRPGWHLTVCNRGVPIPVGMEEAIFDKYTRGGETSGTPGLGLGLYLAREIAVRHGGTLRGMNRTPDRVCFELWLPSIEQGEHR